MDGANETTIAPHDNQAIGNYISVDWNTTTSAFNNLGNCGVDVLVGGPNNTISNNYIEFDVGHGVYLTGVNAHNQSWCADTNAQIHAGKQTARSYLQ